MGGLQRYPQKMTRKQASILERKFSVVLPADYVSAVTESYPFAEQSHQLDTDFESLRRDNLGSREDNRGGFPWRDSYWMIGDDGSGGFYFINTTDSATTVYYCDHEDMPTSIEDTDRIHVSSLSDFIAEGIEMEEWAAEQNRKMTEKVASRRWWQFWIPKAWPPKTSEG